MRRAGKAEYGYVEYGCIGCASEPQGEESAS
jgi:hypothetical protein